MYICIYVYIYIYIYTHTLTRLVNLNINIGRPCTTRRPPVVSGVILNIEVKT